MSIAKLWNWFAKPKNIPRLFALVLAVVLVFGFIVPMELNSHQLYIRPTPQAQIDANLSLAPYDRGGIVLKTPGDIIPQYPENAKALGMITSYMTPIAIFVSQHSPYFGTSIYSSPGGLIDEVLYYTRGFDTIIESSILMMAFVIASWLAIHFTINRKNDPKNIESDVKEALLKSDKVASEVKRNNRLAHQKQNRRDK